MPATPAAPLPFFVYGTLRPGEPNHAWMLRGRVRAETAAVLPGALLYDGPGYPFAVADPRGAGEVRGELVEPLPERYDELLGALDRLEDYVPGRAANLYERVVREVREAGGGSRPAWVYLAAAERERALLTTGRRITSGDWKKRRSAASDPDE